MVFQVSDSVQEERERHRQWERAAGQSLQPAEGRPWGDETSGQALNRMGLEKTDGHGRPLWGAQTAGQALGHLGMEKTQDEECRLKWADETVGQALCNIDLEKTGTSTGMVK